MVGIHGLYKITGGIGHVTRKNRNQRIAIRARAKCKIGEEKGLACQISSSGTSGILLRGVLVLLLVLLVPLGVSVYSGRTKHTYKKRSAQINTRYCNAQYDAWHVICKRVHAWQN